MKKSILFLSAIALLSIGSYAQNTVTSLSSSDIITVKNSSGPSEKRITVGNLQNITGNLANTITGTESRTVTGGYTVVANTLITGTLGVSGLFSPAASINNSSGTVAAPSYAYTSDTDCGGYRIGANNIGFAVNGAKVLDIATTGLGVVGVTSSGDGTVALPGFAWTSDLDCGWYRIGANNIGGAVNGAKVLDIATTGLGVTGLFTASTSIQAGTTVITDAITEKTSGAGITFSKATIRKLTATTYTTVATVSAAAVAGGLIVYTGDAQTLTLPTAAQIGSAIGAAAGTVFEFIVQNTAGSGAATIAVGADITAASDVTGGTDLSLTNSATAGMARFSLLFIDATHATLARLQ